MATPEAQLVLAYRQLRTDVRRLLKDAKERGLSHAFLQSQVTEINKAIAVAEAAEADFAGNAMPSEYVASAAQAHQTLSSAGVKLLSEKFTGLDRAAVRALQTGLAERLGEMKRALTLGLGLGDPRIAAKAIRKVLDGESSLIKVVGGMPKVLTPSGRHWDPDAYAKMLGRTAMADSRRVGFSQRYMQNGVDVVVVVANGSTHATCIAWEGKRLSLTGATEGLPTVDDARAAGLFHPNCRHRYVIDRDAKPSDAPIGQPPQAPKAPPAKAPAPKTPPPKKAPIPKPVPAPKVPARPRTSPLPKASESINWKSRFDPGVKYDVVKERSMRSRPDLTSTQREAVSTYTGYGYRRINKRLRGGGVPSEARLIDAAIAKSPLAKERVLYRGIGGKNLARYDFFRVGAEFDGPGYQSWTVNRGVSANFATGESAGGGSPTVFRLRAPKGTKALWIDEQEYEFILPRGTRYRIVDVEEDVAVSKFGTGPLKMRVVTLELTA